MILSNGATLAIATTSLPPGTVGTPYSAALAATGGTAPYTWSITSASPPAWLSLNPSTGALVGHPDHLGFTERDLQGHRFRLHQFFGDPSALRLRPTPGSTSP